VRVLSSVGSDKNESLLSECIGRYKKNFNKNIEILLEGLPTFFNLNNYSSMLSGLINQAWYECKKEIAAVLKTV